MKKIILFITLLFIPLFVKASDINKIYIDASIDISGNLIVKELIEVDNYDEGVTLNLYYKDESLKKFDKTKESLYGSDIYNADRIKIKSIGILKDNTDINDMYKDDFVKNNVNITDNYKTKDENGYLKLTLNKEKTKTKYYIEYVVILLSVKHNDCAEMYYRYFDKFDYDVPNITIIFRLPYNSKLFSVWAHGNKDIKVTKDDKDSIVMNEITNYKKNTLLDNRIVYDKDIYSIAIVDSKKSDIDAYSLIKEIEKERQDNTKAKSEYLLSIIVITGCIFVSLIVYIVIILIKKKK